MVSTSTTILFSGLPPSSLWATKLLSSLTCDHFLRGLPQFWEENLRKLIGISVNRRQLVGWVRGYFPTVRGGVFPGPRRLVWHSRQPPVSRGMSAVCGLRFLNGVACRASRPGGYIVSGVRECHGKCTPYTGCLLFSTAGCAPDLSVCYISRRNSSYYYVKAFFFFAFL